VRAYGLAAERDRAREQRARLVGVAVERVPAGEIVGRPLALGLSREAFLVQRPRLIGIAMPSSWRTGSQRSEPGPGSGSIESSDVTR
jgi:hypothetical protein